jgi:hypothetical protein
MKNVVFCDVTPCGPIIVFLETKFIIRDTVVVEGNFFEFSTLQHKIPFYCCSIIISILRVFTTDYTAWMTFDSNMEIFIKVGLFCTYYSHLLIECAGAEEIIWFTDEIELKLVHGVMGVRNAYLEAWQIVRSRVFLYTFSCEMKESESRGFWAVGSYLTCVKSPIYSSN